MSVTCYQRLDTIITTNSFSHNHDKIQNKNLPQLEVNLNPPIHAHNTQTIIVHINISSHNINFYKLKLHEFQSLDIRYS